ncbi:MAG TPA: nuclear transport factor 2 family protein [Pseudoduganella sp.]
MNKMILLLAIAATTACTTFQAPPNNAELKQQVADTERAFAATMAKRDHQAFTSFLADETIFYNGSKALRGKETVAAEWKAFYEKPEAPFSWEPDQVEVLDSGTLAHSSGPVRDPQGKITGRFNSVWRQEAPGRWRIVFDKGERVCDCRKP